MFVRRAGQASPRRTTSWARSAFCCLLFRPALELGSQPELDAVAELDHGSWHVGIPMLVDADGVPVREPEQIGHSMGVNQVVDVDLPAHRN